MVKDVMTAVSYSDSKALGLNPLLPIFFKFSAVFVAGIALISISGHNTAGAAVLLLGLPWLALVVLLGIKLIITTIYWGGVSYRKTRAALDNGSIGISYCVRGDAESSYIIVDEPRRLVCVNGRIFRFEDIRQLQSKVVNNKKLLQFSLSSGEAPFVNAVVSKNVSLQNSYTRICNTLGFS